jgi:hypothetical protein
MFIMQLVRMDACFLHHGGANTRHTWFFNRCYQFSILPASLLNPSHFWNIPIFKCRIASYEFLNANYEQIIASYDQKRPFYGHPETFYTQIKAT